eukprot:963466_1
MMQILASLLVLISITQSIIITEHDLGTQSYDQSVAACEAVGQTLASKDEVLDYLGGALGDDVWTPVYVSAGSFNDWLQIGGGTWPYGVLHTEIENGLKPSWGTEATTEYVFKKKFYCSNTIRPAITDPRECLTTQTNMVAWYNSDSIDILNNKWTDKIGGQDGNIIAATGIAVFDGADDQNELYLNGQTIVSGTSATRIDFGNTPFMVPDHTVFNLCKYRDNAAKRGRILDAKLFNGLYGFWWGKSGMAHETGWITQDTQSEFGDNWVLSSQRLDLYRGNGIVLSLPGKIGSALASNLDINNGQAIPDEESDWACGEIIVVNEKLSDNEIQCVEDYFSCKYDLGLTAHCGPQTLLAAENVCFNAKKKLYDYTFNPPANGIISGIKLVHTSGDVRCSQLDTLGTAFGCGNGWGAPNGALLVEMIEEIPGEKKTYYPATGTDGFNLRAGLQCTNGGGCSIGHYDLAGYTGEATEIQFNNPTYEVTKSQEFSIQYGEGCCEESTADNKGESCAKVYFIYDETYLGCPNKPDSFDWDSLTADGTNIPELYTAEDDIFSIPDGTLSLNVKIELEYEGAATGDTGDGPFGVTYVLDFEDFNAYSDHIYEPGTCQNREGNDFYAGTNLRPFNEWWEYSDDPNLPGHIGSQTTMAYPPQTNTFWTQTMSSNDDCGIIVYEGTFTWNDLVACAKTPGTKSYVKTTDGPTDISLSGKIGFYQSIDYKDVDGIPDGEGDHLFKEDKISLLPNQERAHLEFVGKTHITINGDLSDGATIECSGNNACDGAQINGEYIKEFNSDEDRACGQFSLSYINDEGKLEYIYILSALSKPQKHLPIPCNVSRSKSLNVSTIHNTNTKRISHSGSYTSQNIMMFISNSTPSETPPHKPINLPYPITLSPPLTSQHSGSGQSYSSNNNSRSSFTITGSMKNGNDNFYAINNGRHMEQLTEFGHQTIQTYR